jgi:hypothetical protein
MRIVLDHREDVTLEADGIHGQSHPAIGSLSGDEVSQLRARQHPGISAHALLAEKAA